MATGGNESFDEFIVDTKQVSQITRAKMKIERMHEVKIILKEIAKVDSKESKQWIRVEGDMRDRMNARDFIIAMCQPSETYDLQLHDFCQDILNDDNLEEIEKQTNACIEIGDSNVLHIQGSELAVTLAISSLENIIGQSKVEVDGISQVQCTSQKVKEDGPADWEKRLDSTFLRALSNASDGSCKFDDYHNSSPEVKMAILKCLNDDYSENVDDNELFDNMSEKQIKVSSQHPITIYGDDETQNDKFIDIQQSKRVEGVDNLSEQLTETIISSQKPSTSSQAEQEAVKFLRSFGNSAGYSDSIIEEGLMYADDKTKPSEFLDILKQLKDNEKSYDVDTPMDTSDGITLLDSKSPFPPPPQIPSDEAVQSRRSLPKEYKQTLVKHMIAEQDGDMSVTELKKQNEERQKILKEQFESLSKPDSPREGKKRRKKKNKKKPNKTVNQNNNLVNQESKPEDEDETCVLKTFNSSSEEDCVITEVEEPSKPVIFQPVQPVFQYPPTQRQPVGRQSDYHWNNALLNRPEPIPQPVGLRELRYIVIDGSNVAMHHGRGKIFSCQGIKICVDYFLKRGHRKITCFVPGWRKYRPRIQNPISDQEILTELNEQGCLEFTPARRLDNKLISSYDDRYVVELAETVDGIIVSNDQYRDLMIEKASWKKIIEERLLQYNFVGDNFMVPHDPLGQYGPKLDEFLSKPSKQPSPNRKRHLSPQNQPNQGNYWNKPPPSLLDIPVVGPHPKWQANAPTVQQQNPFQMQNQGQFQNYNRLPWGNQGNVQNRLPVRNQGHYQNIPRYQGQNFQFQGQNRYPNFSPQKKKANSNQRQPDKRPQRSPEKTAEIVKQLQDIFPDSKDKISEVVDNHPCETDLTKLSNYIMNALGD